MNASAKPFVKWIGGKRGIVKKLLSLSPKKIRDYYEPFVGAGALFFNIYERAENCFLSDVNEDLINCYLVVQNRVLELVELLKIHQANHNKERYLIVRSQRDLQDEVDRAARFVYLLKTCYNGLYRVNKNNGFNSAPGRNKNYNICDEETLKAASKALSKAELKRMDFSEITPGPRDFVYFDPPYLGTFNGYNRNEFTEEDHIRLKQFAVRLSQNGVNVMISNSFCPFVQELYQDFTVVEITAPRFVSCNGDSRKPVKEIVAVNYVLDQN